MMKIAGITTCVHYADLLSNGIERWTRGLDSLTIVTAMDDSETIKLADHWAAHLLVTSAFYDDGAVFNKGRALSEAYDRLAPDDWVLLFDADIIPPQGWRNEIEPLIDAGNLYGAKRYRDDGRWIGDSEIAGYFQLFHSTDPHAQKRPLLDTHWNHAGNYDSEFSRRWHRMNQKWLPINLEHQGDIASNWFGRGNAEQMSRLFAERRARKGYQHERI